MKEDTEYSLSNETSKVGFGLTGGRSSEKTQSLSTEYDQVDGLCEFKAQS